MDFEVSEHLAFFVAECYIEIQNTVSREHFFITPFTPIIMTGKIENWTYFNFTHQ
jgi:hypothetical protein